MANNNNVAAICSHVKCRTWRPTDNDTGDIFYQHSCPSAERQRNRSYSRHAHTATALFRVVDVDAFCLAPTGQSATELNLLNPHSSSTCSRLANERRISSALVHVDTAWLDVMCTGELQHVIYGIVNVNTCIEQTITKHFCFLWWTVLLLLARETDFCRYCWTILQPVLHVSLY